MKVFISGPMTGIEEYNRPAFFIREEELKLNGHIALNPAVYPLGLKYDEYMALAFAMLNVCDAITFLPGSENSTGSLIERKYAEKLGLVIMH